jgi:hypothetical protein
MDDFAVPTAVAKDRIYVSWEESWELAHYVREYLRVKRCVVNDANRLIVLRCIENYPGGHGMITKVNMDFWLDSNGLNLEPVPEILRTGKATDL